MITYTIKPILTGYQYLDKAEYATFRDGYGIILELPVFAFLLEGNGKKILVDTGMGSTEHSEKYHHNGKQEPGQAIHEQLAKMGISTDAIDSIIFTHLHWDHCFNMDKFPDAQLYVSRIEYEFAMNPLPFYWSSYEYPPATGLIPPFAGRKFNLTDGEQEIFDGISVIPTPGHSPGHIAVSVRTVRGIYYLVGDLMFLRDNMKPDKKKGWPITPPGRFCNILDTWNSINLILSRTLPDYVLMTHDPYHMGTAMWP